MQNLSSENELYLWENKKSFSYRWFRALPSLELRHGTSRKLLNPHGFSNADFFLIFLTERKIFNLVASCFLFQQVAVSRS